MKPRYKRNRSLRLRDKLIIMALLVILPFILFGGYLIETMSREMEQQLKHNAASAHDLMAHQIDEVLLRCNTLADQYSNDWSFNHKLRQLYPSIMDAYPLYEDIWVRFSNHLLSWTKLRYITIYTENPTLVSTTPFILRTDRYLESLNEWPAIHNAGYAGLWSGFRTAKKTYEYWNPQNKNEIDRQCFAYTRMIGTNSAPRAYVTIEVDASALLEIIAEREDDIVSFLLDESGAAVTPFDQAAYADLLTYIQVDESGAVPRSWDLDGYIGWQTGLSNGWTFVSTASLSGVASTSIQMRSTAIIGLGVVTAVILIIALLWSHSMTRRMRLLSINMMAFWSEEQRVPPPFEKTDEIGMLEQSFDAMTKRIHELVENEYVQEVKRKEAQLNLLHTQINPHFLYNTLSSIAWLTDTASLDTVRGAIEDMARYFRLSLAKGRDIISLGEEIQALNAYINLQKLRFNGRIRFIVDVDELLISAQIPRLTLQPLVENSLIHGPGETRRPITIVITAMHENGHVLLSVADDGVGMDDDQRESLMNGTIVSQFGNGIGYTNVNTRLMLLLGPEYGLIVTSSPGQGTRIDIRLPFE